MRFGVATMAAVATLVVAGSARAEQVIGRPAGNFRATDANGQPVSLSDYKGKMVVLEWNNPGCPFVQKHYNSGNMQKTQGAAKAMGVVWLTINSGAPGKQGYMTGPEANAFLAKAKSTPTSYLLDPAGRIGRGYAAKTTPQMFVIDGAGVLRYQGGIDDKPTASATDIASARNHVTAALGEIKAGKAVSVPETRSYGCTVKYAD